MLGIGGHSNPPARRSVGTAFGTGVLKTVMIEGSTADGGGAVAEDAGAVADDAEGAVADDAEVAVADEGTVADPDVVVMLFPVHNRNKQFSKFTKVTTLHFNCYITGRLVQSLSGDKVPGVGGIPLEVEGHEKVRRGSDGVLGVVTEEMTEAYLSGRFLPAREKTGKFVNQ